VARQYRSARRTTNDPVDGVEASAGARIDLDDAREELLWLRLMSTDAVPERDAHPGTRRLHFGDAVLEAPLCSATGDEKVPMTKLECTRPPTSLRA
jgi:hypothetical protein